MASAQRRKRGKRSKPFHSGMSVPALSESGEKEWKALKKRHRGPRREEPRARPVFRGVIPAVDRAKWNNHIATWQAASYDGVRGIPPDWLPAFYRAQFVSAQRRAATFVIARGVSPSSFIKAVSSAARDITREGMKLLMRAESERWEIDDHSLLMLIYVLRATQLGESGGVAFLTDSETAGDLACGRKVKKGQASAAQARAVRSNELRGCIVSAVLTEKRKRTPESGINEKVSRALGTSRQYVGKVKASITENEIAKFQATNEKKLNLTPSDSIHPPSPSSKAAPS